MSPRAPLLGSLAVQSPSQSSQLVHVTPATCHDLSLFKELLKEYRKLDDAVTMRINRTTAQFRDRDRLGASGKGSVQEQACAYLWKELLVNWKRRAEIIDYCVKVVDDDARQAGQGQDRSDHRAGVGDDDGMVRRPSSSSSSSSSLSVGVAAETKYRQVRNELAIEKIVRQRSIDAFVSRCRYFEPPQSADADTRRWWKEAHERR